MIFRERESKGGNGGVGSVVGGCRRGRERVQRRRSKKKKKKKMATPLSEKISGDRALRRARQRDYRKDEEREGYDERENIGLKKSHYSIPCLHVTPSQSQPLIIILLYLRVLKKLWHRA